MNDFHQAGAFVLILLYNRTSDFPFLYMEPDHHLKTRRDGHKEAQEAQNLFRFLNLESLVLLCGHEIMHWLRAIPRRLPGPEPFMATNVLL